MKNKYLYSCIVVLLFLASCAKDEGVEPLTIVRTDVVDDKEADANTIVTRDGGYMEAKARKDMVVANSFEIKTNNENQIENLNVYTVFSSSFSAINNARNRIKQVGYVYASKEALNGKLLARNEKNCQSIAAEFEEAGDSVVFSKRVEGLEFNKTYCVRSYAVCEVPGKCDSVIYNNNILEYSTVLPEDVWFKRNDAPSIMVGRTNPFLCTVDDKVYLYGGSNGGAAYYNDLWTYNANADTWEQKATFEAKTGHYYNTERRANGAAFVYINTINNNDKLIYLVGGELSQDEYTGTVIFYSINSGKFCYRSDHPNAGKQYPRYDKYGNPVYDTDPETGEYTTDPPTQMMSYMSRDYVEDLPIYTEYVSGDGSVSKTRHGLAGAVAFSIKTTAGVKYFVAFGKNDNSNNKQKHIQASIYEYKVQYDKADNGPYEQASMTWLDVSSVADKGAEGFYQPVCVDCGEQGIIVGSGESSKGGLSGNFYRLSYSVTAQQIRMESIAKNPDFTPRANAAAFYLNYQKSGAQYTGFYVGTGRVCSEDEWIKYKREGTIEPELLLNDFWRYDFNSSTWKRRADCSNIRRQGAIGFAVNRVDDYYVREYGVNVRGMFSFGEGCSNSTDYTVRNDNWEYIP